MKAFVCKNQHNINWLFLYINTEVSLWFSILKKADKLDWECGSVDKVIAVYTPGAMFGSPNAHVEARSCDKELQPQHWGGSRQAGPGLSGWIGECQVWWEILFQKVR